LALPGPAPRHPEDSMVLLVLSAWSECRKILIPYGDTERLMKLGNRYTVSRFSNHQNFATASEDAQSERATSGRR
jgi:hypothetical protein